MGQKRTLRAIFFKLGHWMGCIELLHVAKLQGFCRFGFGAIAIWKFTSGFCDKKIFDTAKICLRLMSLQHGARVRKPRRCPRLQRGCGFPWHDWGQKSYVSIEAWVMAS